MAYVLGSPEGDLDRVADLDEMRRVAPRTTDQFLTEIDNLREAQAYARRVSSAGESTGNSPCGFFKHGACIPEHVFFYIHERDPGFWDDTERFCKWLDRHKHFKTGYYKAMTSIGPEDDKPNTAATAD